MATKLTNYPNGISSFGVPVLGSEIPSVTGNVFWVDSGNAHASTAAKGSFEEPLSTIDSAINKCVAANGDMILVKEGHTETLATAGAIALDVAGVIVLGLGVGDNRPTLTFSATAATIAQSGNNTKFNNFILVPSIDSVVSPLAVTGDGCEFDVVIKDASDTVECVRGVLATGSDRLKGRLKYLGRTGGNACVNGVRLVGCSNVTLDVDCYGLASTAWVEYHTTACVDIKVNGYMYNSGTTNGSKDIIDTVTGSTWFGYVFDGSAGAVYSGGSASAWASDDVTAVNSTLATIADVLSGANGIASFPSAAAPANNVSLAEVIRAIYDRQIGDGSSVVTNSLLGKQVTRSTADTITGSAVPIFTVTGRVLFTCIMGKVTTVIGAGATNAKIQFNPTVGTTNNLCIDLDIDSDEAGTLYAILGNPSSALTRSESGCVPNMQSNGIITEDGALEFITSADRTGSISFEVWYFPLSAGASVVAI